MIWRYILILFVPLVLFANEGSNYDILERTINFLLFFGILYYLIESKVKEAYSSRITSIADKLEAVQATLKATTQKKELAKQKIAKAKDDAKSLLATSKKETEILVKKMHDDVLNDMTNLEKAHKEKVLIERRRMKRDVISEVLNEMFDGSALEIDRKEFVDIILKKVA